MVLVRSLFPTRQQPRLATQLVLSRDGRCTEGSRQRRRLVLHREKWEVAEELHLGVREE
jgi:hypothetical protein